MRRGARSPEELELLLEDAFVTRDHDALTELFEHQAVVTADGQRPARGGEEIKALAAAMWNAGRTFVSERPAVVQSGNTSLVVGRAGISVARRGADGAWRYAVSLLSLQAQPKEER